MTNTEAITYIKKEVPDFDIYPLKEREIVIAAFIMGWDMRGRHDLQLVISVQSGSARYPQKAATNKSWASGPVKERVRG